jgi:hypothetical protein
MGYDRRCWLTALQEPKSRRHRASLKWCFLQARLQEYLAILNYKISKMKKKRKKEKKDICEQAK